MPTPVGLRLVTAALTVVLATAPIASASASAAAATRPRKDGLPLDVMVVDSAWSQFEMNFKCIDKFLGGRSAEHWMSEFHARGLTVIVSTKGSMIRPDADLYPEALKLGVLATDGHGNPLTCAYCGGNLLEAENSGLSGLRRLPYWTNDSGGFLSGFLNNDRYGAHAELYERWFEFTCFAPIPCAHKAGPSEPHEHGPGVEATAKKYLQLRYRLMPYLYTLMHEANATGLPMLRPFVLEYQDDAGSADAKTEFLLGADLLVASVIYAGATARDVYFPPGRWISYDDAFKVAGDQSIGVAAPHDRLPLLVRAGAILPNAPDMLATGEKPWDPIALDVWPAGDSTGALYDDRTTLAYARGESTTTTFRCVETRGKSVALTITPANGKFGPTRWAARVHLTSMPTGVTPDDAPVAQADWSFDPATHVLAINFPGGRVMRTVAIALDGSSRPQPAPPRIDVPPAKDDIVTSAAAQTAQFLPPPRLPTRIEAANSDKGGEGLAFHLAVPTKDSVYRADGVPIANSTDTGSGYAVQNLKAGDWLAYTIDAVHGGWFTLDARVRPAANGLLAILRDRTIPLTDVDVPANALAVLRYTNGDGDATVSVATNDAAAVTTTLSALGNWDDYGETAVPLTRRAGENVVRIAGTGSGVINLDQVRLWSER